VRTDNALAFISTSYIAPVTVVSKSADSYLGLLYSMDDVAVYGFITSLKVKIILALALSDAVVRDGDMLQVRFAFIFALILLCLRHLSCIDIQGSSPCVLPRDCQPVSETAKSLG
jgi:hypothetical protein